MVSGVVAHRASQKTAIFDIFHRLSVTFVCQKPRGRAIKKLNSRDAVSCHRKKEGAGLSGRPECPIPFTEEDVFMIAYSTGFVKSVLSRDEMLQVNQNRIPYPADLHLTSCKNPKLLRLPSSDAGHPGRRRISGTPDTCRLWRLRGLRARQSNPPCADLVPTCQGFRVARDARAEIVCQFLHNHVSQTFRAGRRWERARPFRRHGSRCLESLSPSAC